MSQRFPQRTTPLLIEVLTYLLDKPDGAHGYAIIQGLPERPDGGRWQGGAVYPLLRRMVDGGWATREWRRDVYPAQSVVRLTDDLGRPAAAELVNHRAAATLA